MAPQSVLGFQKRRGGRSGGKAKLDLKAAKAEQPAPPPSPAQSPAVRTPATPKVRSERQLLE